MKKRLVGLVIGTLVVGSLFGCKQEGGPATIINSSEDAAHGVVTLTKEKCNSGDKVTFTVQPDDFFSVDRVTFNGKTLSYERKDGDIYTYSAKAKAGENKVMATFAVDPTVNFVEEFDMDISDDIYDYVMSFSESTESNPGTLDGLDFRRDGIEQIRSPLTYNASTQKYSGKADDNDFFFNCVDGDTTHVETFNLKYTVKIRYLMDDTQESTSQMEEWGLSGSYFSKYTFWGEFGKENNEAAHYEQKIQQLYSPEELARLTGGATHIILMSKAMAYAGSNATLEEIKSAKGQDPEFKGPYASTTDGNQRDLAFVWYAKSTKAKPDKTEFRCLNLELIYEGFSENTGSAEAYGNYYFKNFDAAGLSAQANRRHMHSGERDPFYYYYEDDDVVVPTLPLYKIYTTDAPQDDIIGYIPKSDRCDKMRLWAVEGYVSRKVGGAFYIQDKPEYTEEDLAIIKSNNKNRRVGFGIYVFTYSQTPIDEGQHVRVVGALSSYGGTFQMQGISYTAYSPNPKRNTTILDYNEDGSIKYYDIKPIQLTVEEFHTLQLPQVLVQIKDNVYFNNFTVDQTAYDEGFVDVCEGGKHEVNRYNKDFYQFYNVYNSLTLFARYGDVDNTPTEIETIHNGDTMRKDNSFLRIIVNSEVLVSYRGETAFSYKFFTGGTEEYNAKGPKYIGEEGTITTNYSRKILQKDATEGGSVIGISKGYISTTWKTFKMEIEIVKAYDISHYIKKASV